MYIYWCQNLGLAILVMARKGYVAVLRSHVVLLPRSSGTAPSEFIATPPVCCRASFLRSNAKLRQKFVAYNALYPRIIYIAFASYSLSRITHSFTHVLTANVFLYSLVC